MAGNLERMKAAVDTKPRKPVMAEPQKCPRPWFAKNRKKRLPEGSTFGSVYRAVDKTKGIWTAWLQVPDVPRFFSTAGSLFAAFGKLDNYYRKWLKEQIEKERQKVAGVVKPD